MRRMTALGLLLAVGSLSLTLAAYQQPQAPAQMVLTVDKLRDNLFVLKGGGGNTAVFIRSNGVVVVDTKNAGWGHVILDKIKELTPQPVTIVINTHSHGDHVSGNVEFPANVEFIAHANAAKNMQAWPDVFRSTTPFPNVFKESGGKGLPTRTYTDKLTLGAGSERIDLLYFGRGHTNGDTWVVFPSLRVAHAGDIFANKGIPLMDKNHGGTGIDLPATLTKAYSGLANVDTIINGHSQTTTTREDLKMYGDYVREFVAFVQTAKKAGKSVDDVVATWKVPDKYPGFTAAEGQVRTATEVIFGELK